MKLSEDVGHRIRVRRVELKMSQADLAGRLGISQAFLSNIEKARNTLNVDMLGEIAKALDCSVCDFFDETRRGA